jgi:uncharacterized protein (DUF736 family)
MVGLRLSSPDLLTPRGRPRGDPERTVIPRETRNSPPAVLRCRFGLSGAAASVPACRSPVETAIGWLAITERNFIMATIGTFKKTASGEYTGEIVTLSVQAKGVRIVPQDNRSNDNAPSHRVLVNRAEIGAAWSKTSNEGRDYLAVKLDDPSFNAPIYANLFDDEGGESFSLIWSRPNGRRGDS